jgi:hypothetical protein
MFEEGTPDEVSLLQICARAGMGANAETPGALWRLKVLIKSSCGACFCKSFSSSRYERLLYLRRPVRLIWRYEHSILSSAHCFHALMKERGSLSCWYDELANGTQLTELSTGMTLIMTHRWQ